MSVARVLAVTAAIAAMATVARAQPSPDPPAPNQPIEHVVVIFDENVSFDHYFGTYPVAANTDGEHFEALPGTPAVEGLTPALLNNNPNAANPQRLTHAQAVTCDQDHNYLAEQKAFNGGAMDKFVENTSGPCGIVMDYYDGNTVTALWNLAQHFALNDHSFGTTFGPSTPGALNLISGQTHSANGTTIISDPDPVDDCGTHANTLLSGKNIGDLMNAKGVTWGWFQGGFADCAAKHPNAAGVPVFDYSAHHEPFQYYASTRNEHHVRPTAAIGASDGANHQYDLSDFTDALAAGKLPQVSFLKPMASQDAHPGNSGPLDEQKFLVSTLNALQQSPQWDSTAVFIAYDDSDGWYDHFPSPVVNGSADAANDFVPQCGGVAVAGGYNGRCGYGPRLPLLVISPYARENFVDHTITEQTSIIRFIEDNWNLGRIGDASFDARPGAYGDLLGMFEFSAAPAPKLFLDPSTGQPTGSAPPEPTPTATAIPTAIPTAVPTATPAPPGPAVVRKPKVAIKLACHVSGGGRKVTVACKASGKDAAGRTSALVRIMRGRKVLASKRAKIAKKKLKLMVRPHAKLKPGRYTLTITLTQSARTRIVLTRHVRLR
jgi:phospholipase C